MMPKIRFKVTYSLIVTQIILIVFSACRSRENTNRQPEAVQHTLTKVYTLYQKIGYHELDTLGKTVDKLDRIIQFLDSADVKPKEYDQMVNIRNRLSTYLTSYNDFYEEIYSVEDKLLSLENAYITGKIGESELRKRIKNEEIMLDDIDVRVRSVHRASDSVLSLISRIPLDVEYSD